MNSICLISRVLIFLAVGYLSALRAFAQEAASDSVHPYLIRTTNPEIMSLKRHLLQNAKTGSAQTNDSLLLISRQLAYQPGEVVALCQRAAFQFQQGQPQQADITLNEAQRIAANLQNIPEAGWAMRTIALIQQKNPTYRLELIPLVNTLGKVMNTSADVVHKQQRVNVSVEKQPRRVYQREPNPIAITIPASPSITIPQLPNSNSYRYDKPLKVRLNFTEQWLDSLINTRTNHSGRVQQLTTTKKLRDSSKQLSQEFAQKGDYAKAYNYFLQYTAYKDSLAAEVTARQVALLHYKQNTQKKEAQIKLLTKERELREQETNQQKQFVVALLGLAALLLAYSVTLIRTNRQRQQANQQLNEQKAMLEATVTELKATQNQLIQSEKMAALGELTAGIAHEIQNPLNFVNNFSEVSTELIEELTQEWQRPDGDSDLQEELLTDLKLNLEKITHHGGRASAIVRGMLEHSRSIAGEKQPTDLNTLVDEYLKLAYHAIRNKDHAFEASIEPLYASNLPAIKTVHQEIGRVLLNIFSNAFYALQQKRLKHEPGFEPTLTVQTRLQDKHLVVQIRDNGTGIPSANTTKIFQPFFTTKPNGEGTGLGLSLSYDIITKSYGGTILVESETDQFTEFTIMLPLV